MFFGEIIRSNFGRKSYSFPNKPTLEVSVTRLYLLVSAEIHRCFHEEAEDKY